MPNKRRTGKTGDAWKTLLDATWSCYKHFEKTGASNLKDVQSTMRRIPGVSRTRIGGEYNDVVFIHGARQALKAAAICAASAGANEVDIEGGVLRVWWD